MEINNKQDKTNWNLKKTQGNIEREESKEWIENIYGKDK